MGDVVRGGGGHRGLVRYSGLGDVFKGQGLSRSLPKSPAFLCVSVPIHGIGV